MLLIIFVWELNPARFSDDTLEVFLEELLFDLQMSNFSTNQSRDSSKNEGITKPLMPKRSNNLHPHKKF